MGTLLTPVLQMSDGEHFFKLQAPDAPPHMIGPFNEVCPAILHYLIEDYDDCGVAYLHDLIESCTHTPEFKQRAHKLDETFNSDKPLGSSTKAIPPPQRDKSTQGGVKDLLHATAHGSRTRGTKRASLEPSTSEAVDDAEEQSDPRPPPHKRLRVEEVESARASQESDEPEMIPTTRATRRTTEDRSLRSPPASGHLATTHETEESSSKHTGREYHGSEKTIETGQIHDTAETEPAARGRVSVRRTRGEEDSGHEHIDRERSEDDSSDVHARDQHSAGDRTKTQQTRRGTKGALPNSNTASDDIGRSGNTSPGNENEESGDNPGHSEKASDDSASPQKQRHSRTSLPVEKESSSARLIGKGKAQSIALSNKADASTLQIGKKRASGNADAAKASDGQDVQTRITRSASTSKLQNARSHAVEGDTNTTSSAIDTSHNDQTSRMSRAEKLKVARRSSDVFEQLEDHVVAGLKNRDVLEQRLSGIITNLSGIQRQISSNVAGVPQEILDCREQLGVIQTVEAQTAWLQVIQFHATIRFYEEVGDLKSRVKSDQKFWHNEIEAAGLAKGFKGGQGVGRDTWAWNYILDRWDDNKRSPEQRNLQENIRAGGRINELCALCGDGVLFLLQWAIKTFLQRGSASTFESALNNLLECHPDFPLACDRILHHMSRLGLVETSTDAPELPAQWLASPQFQLVSVVEAIFSPQGSVAQLVSGLDVDKLSGGVKLVMRYSSVAATQTLTSLNKPRQTKRIDVDKIGDERRLDAAATEADVVESDSSGDEDVEDEDDDTGDYEEAIEQAAAEAAAEAESESDAAAEAESESNAESESEAEPEAEDAEESEAEPETEVTRKGKA